ncbi:hypothetical protein GCM10009504_38530 [Pseudomonas laurentiana]|uniref:hypothetical protein n=1 Tax=Pseudomonas laurentiana TaxID=2364649 RepID=UPI0016778321|nr:hypothetical protein [Pseudomonas laurentiana]GGU77787.1 hypothetical protein GCM10009504_38530 [Pseudomonas laurentiana]
MQSLKGIRISFVDPARKVMDVACALNIAGFFSANDCWFNPPECNEFTACCTARSTLFFMPLSQAVTPKIWSVIGTWLAADEKRKLQITVGEEKSETDSLSGVLEVLERILFTYSSIGSDA